MRVELARELEKIGLSENEAKVYLAGLELGPSTAQMIAAKATVSRPTTYIMIESLIKRGLMSSFQKGKKKMFVSGKPRQLLYILEQQKKALEDRTNKLSELLIAIEKEGPNQNTMPVVVYEGPEGTRAIQDDLSVNSKEVWEIVPLDLARELIPPVYPGDTRESFSKKFKIKALYTSASRPDGRRKENVEYRYLSSEQFPIASEILIYGDKVILTNFDSKRLSLHIEDKVFASSFRAIFISLWDKAEPG
ncbi:MAG TPA: helix-turn-helix domain-containing protein [Candidatus Eisenbacteria bacterium]|nr:helix-turn-helix domain-containing protein [Candidatus Eisenbacteria bacterium]